ncbi:hypothetical protein [Psychrobacillus sp.]|uniref:hypothetical protein n=1 Tax=Psychrobacillus sp. TaxID=1871623 RepID=UPI0028BF0815|nr:hypothetical protein [Psychrobacillus sp.]
MVVNSWDVKEQFLFPASFGVPKEIKAVAVTPQFEQTVIDDSIQISGIYHITCHVAFEEGELAHHATSEFTQIEDLDVQGEVGYFEYAVPMSIDIPKDKVQPGYSPTLTVQDVHSKTTEHPAIEIGWSVQCAYEPAALVKEEILEEVEQVVILAETKQEAALDVQESTVFEQSELQFIFDLDDGMSKQTFPSNNILVKQEAEK